MSRDLASCPESVVPTLRHFDTNTATIVCVYVGVLLGTTKHHLLVWNGRDKQHSRFMSRASCNCFWDSVCA